MNTTWKRSYESWEVHALPATDETVREAMLNEADGWPMPISGDLTAVCGHICDQRCPA